MSIAEQLMNQNRQLVEDMGLIDNYKVKLDCEVNNLKNFRSQLIDGGHNIDGITIASLDIIIENLNKI